MLSTPWRALAPRAVASRVPIAVPRTSPALLNLNRKLNQLPNTTTVRYSSTSNNATREIVSQALQSIGSKRESQHYLRLFSSAQTFCVLKVGGAIM